MLGLGGGLPGAVPLDLSQTGSQGSCQCWQQHGADTAVFYNRVPKCGSTTMLSYIDNASKRLGFPNGSTGPERNAFNFYQATQPEDFDNSRWAPGPSRAHEILSSILAEAPGRRTLHERHMHFLDPEGLRRERAAAAAANGSSSSGRNLVYINLLRDPGALRASSFYFARDCICMQRPAYNYTIRNSSWYEIQDEWCKTEWHRKSEALCATDVNSCYADLDSCRRTFPADALGGTVELDFMCGTHADCADDQPIEVKFPRALRNLRDSYLWVGVLERLQDSLRLLQTLLPEYFGHMNASHWAQAHFQPDHVASEHGAPASSEDPAAAPTGGSAPPSAETIAIMRRDPHMRAEFELYERANDVLNCKLQGCGLAGGGGGSGAGNGDGNGRSSGGGNPAGLAPPAEGAGGRGGPDTVGSDAAAAAGADAGADAGASTGAGGSRSGGSGSGDGGGGGGGGPVTQLTPATQHHLQP